MVHLRNPSISSDLPLTPLSSPASSNLSAFIPKLERIMNTVAFVPFPVKGSSGETTLANPLGPPAPPASSLPQTSSTFITRFIGLALRNTQLPQSKPNLGVNGCPEPRTTSLRADGNATATSTTTSLGTARTRGVPVAQVPKKKA